MSWTGNYLGRDGAIQRARKKFRASAKTGSDYARLASVFYSAANRFFADVLRGRIWMLAVAIWYASAAAGAAARAYAFSRHGVDLTLDNIDAVLSVWKRYGNPINSEMIQERRVLAQHTVKRVNAGESCAWHTQAFLRMHNWRAHYHDPEAWQAADVILLAQRAEAAGERAQAGRIFKQLARSVPRSDPRRRWWRAVAKALAARAGATDQVKKWRQGCSGPAFSFCRQSGSVQGLWKWEHSP